ncbi:MAG: hypothetical protein H0W99_07285 [Acidobacteria bacterium]|nr:hypothetical protein [Acidobacteriota bacterium]
MRLTKRLVLPVLFVLFFTACPSGSDLDRAAKASQEISRDLVIANKVVAEFYVAGKIPLAKKDKIAAILGQMGDKGNKFNETLIALDVKYPQGTIPPENLSFLKANLSEIRGLLTAVFGELLPFGAQSAVKSLDKHVTVIEGVVK